VNKEALAHMGLSRPMKKERKKERKGRLVQHSSCLYPVDTSVYKHAYTSTRKHDSFPLLFQF
jgi:hypothetical protein